ncbi:hypothetical protein ACF0H5_021450 [Mactra antiquata]
MIVVIFSDGTCTVDQKLLEKLLTERSLKLVQQNDTNKLMVVGQDSDQRALQIKEDIGNKNGAKVLLNSYMRSGSSYMGRILGHRQDVFYYYEPLWTNLIWVYHKGEEKLCSNIKPNQCKSNKVEFQTSRKILQNVYNCELRKIGPKFKENPHSLVGYAGEKWQKFTDCRNQKRDQSTCLSLMEQTCRNNSYVVTKVLRLDLTLAEIILQDIPGLKIVHLFRDPRGAISSHVFTKWFPIKLEDLRSIEQDAEVLCDRMKTDIMAALKFHEKYPNRLRGIQYEDFYDAKEKVRLLYEYVGMTADDSHLDFVENLPNERGRTKYNSTDNHVTKLFSYRDVLPWRVVNVVEMHCSEVISLLGLNLFETENNYNDKNFSPINGQLTFGLRKS